MKLLPLALLLLVPALAPAQQAAPLPLVTTTGSAEIKVAPDLADLSFEVEVRNLDLAVARKDQAERAVKVLAAMRAAGVPESDLNTSQVQISASYYDGQKASVTLQYYQVTQSFCCTLHDVKKVPDFTAAVVSAGATGARDAVLRNSGLRKYKDEARRKAIVAAKEKAVAFATELGVKVGRPQTINEGSSYSSSGSGSNYQNNTSNAVAASYGPETEETSAFAPGLISITASVNVSFLLE